MLKIWDAANFRRTLAALCLIGAPLFFAGAELLSPPGTDTNDPNALLATLAQYHDRQMLSTVLGLIAAILFIPLVFGLIHIFSERGVVLGHIGGGLALLGAGLNLVLGGLNLALWAMSAPGVDRAAMTGVFNGLGSSPVMGVILMGHDIFAMGIILLGAAALRSRIVPNWTGICIILAVLVDILLSSTLGDNLVISVLSDALLIVGFGGIAWELLSASDARWEQMAALENA